MSQLTLNTHCKREFKDALIHHVHSVSVNAEATQDDDRPDTPPAYDVAARHSPEQLEDTLAGIRAAGTLFPGDGLVYQVGARQVCDIAASGCQ